MDSRRAGIAALVLLAGIGQRSEARSYPRMPVTTSTTAALRATMQSIGSMTKIQDDILSYREMCDAEKIQTLQRGMNFRLNNAYSVILMSQHANAPYRDRIYSDGVSIEYEGHDSPRRSHGHDPKDEDQPGQFPSGRLTQNGLFARAVEQHKT
jgi:hypothetical protein